MRNKIISFDILWVIICLFTFLNYILPRKEATLSLRPFLHHHFNYRKEPGDKDVKSIQVSGQLTTYPSPRSQFCPKWDVSVNVDLGQG